ncbi:hypothetical protein [Salinispora fenicalii]|uniref:hypothetical protein n=1 Tax=Salinispora fenicalii TaxID=1137263 RepID=UPI0004B0284B|nr:hypothetical protein [Salinispora fenicalii]
MFTLAGGAVIYPQAEALDTYRTYDCEPRTPSGSGSRSRPNSTHGSTRPAGV